MALLQALVHALQKFQRRTVDAAVGVTLPVDQAGDCVHAQAVSVEHLQPVVGAGLDKAADLAAGVHEVAAAPLALAHGCGGILVQRGAVKFFQAVAVDRKVYRHKVQNDADARFMAGVDELGQLLRGAVAAGGGVKAGDLVAPAAVKGMLGQRHQLDVGKAVLLAVGRQQLGQLGVGVPAAVLFLPPAAGVDFVDIQRLIEAFRAAGHPLVIGEAGGAVGNDAAAVGAQGHGGAVRVAVGHGLTVGTAHPILVDHARIGTGDIALPNGGLGAVHVIGADLGLHRNVLGGRCPNCKMGAPKVGVGAKELVSIKGVPGVKILHIHRENLDFDRRRGMSKSLPLRDRLS